MIAWGAAIGLVGGIVAQVTVGRDVHGELGNLVRLAMLLPAAFYVLWWVAFPGVALDRDDIAAEDADGLDVDERLKYIESAFNDAAMPIARHRSILPADRAATERFRASIRRGRATTQLDVEQFGLRRTTRQPDGHAEQG
jgi:hypothetical protein